MGPIFAVGGLLVVLAAYAVWVQRSRRVDAEEALARFDMSSKGETGPVSAGLGRIARSASTTKTIAELGQSPMMKALKEKLVASGKFDGNVDVFLSYQAAALLVGIVLEFCALAMTTSSGMIRLALLLGGIGIAGFPWNTVNQAARKAASEAEQSLPDFVELLQIPLATGMSVERALRFTVDFAEGPVAREVTWLLDTLQARTTSSEAEAYRQAGRRIGSPEAIAFFNALAQAQVQGAAVSEILDRQAASLRAKAHQARRARIKRLPVTMVVAFALHFLPLLFFITVYPLVSGLSNL